jgi:hypothetical protein
VLDFGLYGLIAAYVALGVILLSLHIYSNWSPIIKAAATLMLALFFTVTYRSYPGLLGWPFTTERLPSRLYLIGLEVAEPDQVYLWARDLGNGLGYQQPRAYALPYSKTLHEKAAEAGRKLRRGLEIILEVEPAGNVTMKLDAGETVIGTSTLRFIDAPQGLATEK